MDCGSCIHLHHTETIEMIQRDGNPEHTSEKPKPAVVPVVPPVRPPHKYLPFHPACKSSWNIIVVVYSTRDAMIHNLSVSIYCRFCITIQQYIV